MRLRDSPVIVNSITERAEKQNTELVIAEQTSSHTKHRGCSNTVGIISITLGTLMRTVSERRGGFFSTRRPNCSLEQRNLPKFCFISVFSNFNIYLRYCEATA